MNQSRSSVLAQLLREIEQEMRRLGLWQQEPPSVEALASTEPFCVDTLSLGEWLQFLLIPRMQELLSKQLPLPGNCNIHAIAEESFKDLPQDCSRLLDLIQHFDQALTQLH